MRHADAPPNSRGTLAGGHPLILNDRSNTHLGFLATTHPLALRGSVLMKKHYCGMAAKWAVCLSAAGALVILSGCSDPEPVRVYTIDRRVPEELQSTNRMLGAIIPQDGANWFVKLTGPETAVDSVAEDVRQFVADLQFEDGQPVLEWPDTWQQVSPGDGPFAPFAKALIDAEENQLALTLSRLGRRADWDADVNANVNRWRQQMGLEPLETRWAGAEPLDETAGDDPTTLWVDLVAEGDGGGGGRMTPPMFRPSQMAGAGRGGDTAASGGDADPHASMVPAPEAAESAAGEELQYDVPEGWTEGRRGGMRLATLHAGEGDEAVEVTFIRAGGDLRSNVQMWAGQVAGDAADAAMVDAVMESVDETTVAGQPARRMVITPPESAESTDEKAAEAIDVVVVEPDAPRPLFIKMKGPAEAVAKQHDAMTQLLESVQLTSPE